MLLVKQTNKTLLLHKSNFSLPYRRHKQTTQPNPPPKKKVIQRLGKVTQKLPGIETRIYQEDSLKKKKKRASNIGP